jgi:hypothetical protein
MVNAWRKWLHRTFGLSKTAPIRRPIAPRLESLEDRLVPAINATFAPQAAFTEGNAGPGVVLATFTDTTPHAANQYNAVVTDWGDGASSTVNVTLAGSTYTVTGSHVYADELTAGTINLSITDTVDADTASGTVPVTVAEGDVLTADPVQPTEPTPTEGQSFSAQVANFVNPNAANTTPADFSATINWGDGTTSAGVVANPGASNIFTVNGTHTYADEGTFTVTVTLSDDAPGTATATATNSITVAEGDVLTADPAQPTEPTPTEGQSFSAQVANFVNPNAANTTPADFTATIDWGDGTTTAGVVANPGASNIFTVNGTHTYADEGTFTVTVTLSDDAPGTATATATNSITVAEGDVLTVNPIQPTLSATEGQSFSGRVANFVNPNAAATTPGDFTATIDWGDGTTTAGVVGNPAATNIYTVDGTHTYADEGSFTVTVVLSDDAPGTATATASNPITVAEGDVLTVNPIQPTLSATEGQSFSGRVANFVNPNAANTTPGDFTATIDWGDGTTTAGVVGNPAATNIYTVDGSHTYADEGSFTVTVVLSDDAPGTATATASNPITVADADSLSGTAAPIQTVEGTPVGGVIANFTDTDAGNTAADFTATIAWGDGTTTAGTVSGGGGAFAVSGSHTYTASGSFTVAVTLRDDAPGTASATATAAALVGGDVVVQGTSANDVLTVSRTPGGGVGSITYVLNGGPPVTLTGVHSFTFDGRGGTALMDVQFANGAPLVPAGVGFDGGAGVNALTVDAAGLPVRDVPGALTVGDRDPQTVSYVNVQIANVNNAAAVVAVAGPDTADRATAFVGLSANERFVQAVYLDELGRAGARPELDVWAALFNSGITQSQARLAIAGAVQHSPEARDHLVKSWYSAFLGRHAGGGEEQGWANLLLAGHSEEQVLSLFLASPEFYARAQTLIPTGSADERYVQALYLLLLDRTGEASGVAGWLGALPTFGRQGVALGFLHSQEFRTDQSEGYYNALVHRPDDRPGLNAWVLSNLDIGSIRVGFEASPEFFADG